MRTVENSAFPSIIICGKHNYLLAEVIVRLFIQRIEIGEREVKYSRSSEQSVKIVYRDIGNMDSPMEPGERQPHTTSVPSIEECLKLLA